MLLSGAVGLASGFIATAAAAEDLSVIVRESKLHTTPSHWSPVSAQLHYGDSLSSISLEGGWQKVQVAPPVVSSVIEGFVHSSAVSPRKVVLVAGAQVNSSGVDPANVVLAGKGFNEDVEDLYRTNEKQLDFAQLDRWEQQTIPDIEVLEFLQQGGLVK